MNLELLDCTLRDGGCANNFDFGEKNIKTVKSNLEKSGVELIELGYINDSKGSTDLQRTQVSNVNVFNPLLKNKKDTINYLGMIDYGTFDFDKLPERTEDSIDGIRLAFHKKDMFEAIADAKKAIAKNYKVFMQPMVIMKYSDKELEMLTTAINKGVPEAEACYIVDSFGYMDNNDVAQKYVMMDKLLNKDIKIGFHGHNNMLMSYSNTLSFIGANSSRNIIIDSTIGGMGKGAGNLPTELIMKKLNESYGKNYDIEPIYETASDVINKYRSSCSWGYDTKYILSAIHQCTPSYVNHYMKKDPNISLSEINSMLEKLDESKKIAFYKDYAEQIYDETRKEILIENGTPIGDDDATGR